MKRTLLTAVIILSLMFSGCGFRSDPQLLDYSPEEARRLYTAHKLTLYARTMPSSLEAGGGVSSVSALASSGDGTRVTSKRVDDVAVTYASGTSSSASFASGFADLAETLYGQQLFSLLRMHSYPRYVP